MPCSGLFTDCPCALFILYMSTHVLLVAILFFCWCLCTWPVSLYLVRKEWVLLLLFLDKLLLIFLPQTNEPGGLELGVCVKESR